jgi:SpoVK/Ycf46/Vps4 family AAA+-type ATPase
VAARVFGTFLSWLQDKKSPVFVVATANDISSLPPEVLRQERFDEIFFVDLPDKKQREEILRIHLAQRGRSGENFDLNSLSESCGGFSGAELEQAVIEGLFRAFEADREIETGDITQAVEDTFPLSCSRAAEIAALKHWATKNARAASH